MCLTACAILDTWADQAISLRNPAPWKKLGESLSSLVSAFVCDRRRLKWVGVEAPDLAELGFHRVRAAA